MTCWQCAAKAISSFVIFAVLVLRLCCCRPYKVLQTVKFFINIKSIGRSLPVPIQKFNIDNTAHTTQTCTVQTSH